MLQRLQSASGLGDWKSFHSFVTGRYLHTGVVPLCVVHLVYFLIEQITDRSLIMHTFFERLQFSTIKPSYHSAIRAFLQVIALNLSLNVTCCDLSLCIAQRPVHDWAFEKLAAKGLRRTTYDVNVPKQKLNSQRQSALSSSRSSGWINYCISLKNTTAFFNDETLSQTIGCLLGLDKVEVADLSSW